MLEAQNTALMVLDPIRCVLFGKKGNFNMLFTDYTIRRPEKINNFTLHKTKNSVFMCSFKMGVLHVFVLEFSGNI